MNVLVTGAAGFIGFHISKRLLQSGYRVYGLDNFSSFYDVSLKTDRLKELEGVPGDLTFKALDLLNTEALNSFFKVANPDCIIHLAAQANVRYSIKHPVDVINNNILSFMHLLEQARLFSVGHLVYASSSSVYGNNRDIPFKTSDNVDYPVSMYAASKKSNELMAHVYSSLYNIPSTGLRFFTVYGPWGRPDMSTFLFSKAIFEGKPIKLFNYGRHRRDFTYIDDVIEGLVKVLNQPPERNGQAPYALYNIGNNKPVELLDFVRLLEDTIGKKAITEGIPMQPGDVVETYADINDLVSDCDYQPRTDIQSGIKRFVTWYKAYYGYE